jgi:hypothetical protein
MNMRRRPFGAASFIVGTLARIVFGICLIVGLASGIGLVIFIESVLFIPDQLGLLRHPDPDYKIGFWQEGRYPLGNLTSGDYLIHYIGSGPDPIIDIYPETSTQRVPLKYHDSVRERPEDGINIPLYEFYIWSSGNYEIEIEELHGRVIIGPNLAKHADRIFILSLIPQSVVLVLVIRGLYSWKNRNRLASEKAKKSASRERFIDWMDGLDRNISPEGTDTEGRGK